MSLYFEETGNSNGKKIVFIHGGGVGSWMWKKQLDFFKNYHCILINLPEHGKNSKEILFSIDNSSKSIIEIINKTLNHKKVYLVGHSLGAQIVINLLGKIPEMIEKAIVCSALVNPSPLLYFLLKPFFGLTIKLLKYKWILKSQAKQFKLNDLDMIDNFISDNQLYSSSMLDRVYHDNLNFTIPKNLKNIKVPTLIIAGKTEVGMIIKSVRNLVRILPVSKGVFINKEFHFYPWHKPEVLNALIYNWIENENVELNENIRPAIV